MDSNTIYQKALFYIKHSDLSRCISWHLAQDLGLKTRKVNYELDKFVKAGELRKETSKYCTIYYKTTNNDINFK